MIRDEDISILKFLEDLTLEKNKNLTNAIFKNGNIKNLKLFENTLITDDGILQSKKISRVFLSLNELITKKVLNTALLPYLSIMHVKNFKYFNGFNNHLLSIWDNNDSL